MKFVITGTLFQFFANLMQGTVGTYFGNYMTDTALIPASAASIIMLVACVWDLFIDPAIGGMIERTNSRWGKYRPYILICAPVLTLVFYVILFFFGRTSFVFLCVVSFLATCSNAMTQALQSAYIGDTIDYIQLKEGSTFGAMVNSIKIFACKVGSAIANYGILAMLAATGYVENVVGAGQSAAAVEGINIFRFGLPAVCAIVMLIVTALYPIRKNYPEIRAMKERMAAELEH